MNKLYITYEQPFNGRTFTTNQIQEVYRDLADKKEYPDFNIWIINMLKSGVFEEVKDNFDLLMEEMEKTILCCKVRRACKHGFFTKEETQKINRYIIRG